MLIKSEIVSWPAVCQRLPGDLGFTGPLSVSVASKTQAWEGLQAGSSGPQGWGPGQCPRWLQGSGAGTRHPGAPTCTPSPTHHPCLPAWRGYVWGGWSGVADGPAARRSTAPLPACLHRVVLPTRAARADWPSVGVQPPIGSLGTAGWSRRKCQGEGPLPRAVRYGRKVGHAGVLGWLPARLRAGGDPS